MSTYSPRRQVRISGENPAAPVARSQPNRSAPQLPECPVLLRLPDVSRASIEEGFRHTTPLEMQSALECIGTAPLTETTAPPAATPQPSPALNPNEQAFASLLAASPAFHGKTQAVAEETHQPSKQEFAPQAVRPAPQPKPIPRATSEPETEPEPKTAAAPLAEPKTHRTDKPAVKPVRRTFRVYRPLWMPEIPPTLVLGALICSSALLVGMLWRNNNADYHEPVIPAAKEKQQPAAENVEAAQTPRMAEVPTVPEVPSSPTKKREQPLKTAHNKTKPAKSRKQPDVENDAPETKVAAEPVQQKQEIARQTQPVPDPAAEMNALPPVEAPHNNFYGQTLGGPPPQVVNNPHVGNPSQFGNPGTGQGPIYEARRPAAEFRGMITKPDVTDNYERY